MPAVKLRATTILSAFAEAQTELVGKGIVLTDGKAGTVETVWLDEVHGLRISIRGHYGKWPISIIKFAEKLLIARPRLTDAVVRQNYAVVSSTRVRRRARLINLRFQISSFLNQDGSKLGVGSCLGALENRCRLTHEIIPAYVP